MCEYTQFVQLNTYVTRVRKWTRKKFIEITINLTQTL